MMNFLYQREHVVPTVLAGAGVIVMAASLRLYRRFHRDMQDVRAAMESSLSDSSSQIFRTSTGLAMQYIIQGDKEDSATPITTISETNKKSWCLVLHPAGGGCDQGLLLGEWLLPRRHQAFGIVAISRAGYLQSDKEASFEAQVNAIVELLDHLRLPKVTVFGLSAGGILSVELARRCPLRVSRLVLLSPLIPYSEQGPDESMPNPPEWLLKLAFGNDFIKWVAVRLFPDAVIQSMFVDARSLSKTDSPWNEHEGRKRALAFLETLLPARERFPGFLQDFEAMRTHQLTCQEMMEIQCPILFLACENDVQSKLEYNRLPIEMRKSHKGQITEIIRESGTHMLLNDIHGSQMAIETFLKANSNE